MTLKEIERRIKRIAPKPLLLLCLTPDGEEKEMTLQQCIDSNSDFLKVLDGNDLNEIDRLFKYQFDKWGIENIFDK